MAKINLFEPYRGEEEIEAVKEVIESGWWKEGPKCLELEEKWSGYTGAKNSITVNSASVGLDLIFKAYGIKDCDVIVPAMTFITTGLAGLWNNCRVIFADSQKDTLTIDPEDVKKKITPYTKAIVVQHMSGHPCDMDAFDEFKEKGMLIIEDAAHGCGSLYKNKHVGIENPAIFSFNAVKNIASGEGGIVTTPDDEIAEKMRVLRWCGIDSTTWQRDGKKYKWDYSINEVGYKYHFNDILAAIALVQLGRLDFTNKKRRNMVERYTERFIKDRLPVYIPREEEWARSSWHQFIIRVDEKDRNPLLDWLGERSIGCGVHYKPINQYSLWPHGETPVVDAEWKKMITLPLHPRLTIENVDEVCDAIKEYYNAQN